MGWKDKAQQAERGIDRLELDVMRAAQTPGAGLTGRSLGYVASAFVLFVRARELLHLAQAKGKKKRIARAQALLARIEELPTRAKNAALVTKRLHELEELEELEELNTYHPTPLEDLP